MARRDVTDYRTVANVVADAPSDLVPRLAEMGQHIIRQSQEAKITENLSSAQVEINGLTNKFQIQYEGDPFNEQGIKDYQQSRQEIIDKYGEGISPLFGRAWKDSSASLAKNTDIQNQAWGFKQSAVNTRNSIKNSMQNYLNQAMLDGQSGVGDVATLANYAQAKESLSKYISENVGDASAAELTRDLGQDWVKMYISGVSDSDPVRAALLINSDAVKNEISDQLDFAKFKVSINNRAEAHQKKLGQLNNINQVRRDNAPLANGGKLSYAHIEESGLSDKAKAYYMKLNGFEGSGARGGFTDADKAQYKIAVFDAVSKITRDPDKDGQAVTIVNDAIIDAMHHGAITQTQGAGWIKQIVEPLATAKEGILEDYSSDTWVPFEGEDFGLGGIQKFYEENIETKPLKDEEAGDLTKASNAVKKANLYDFYMGALQNVAGANGVAVGDIPNLPKGKRIDIYSKAQEMAKESYLKEEIPELRLLHEMPNFVITQTGKTIGVKGGKVELKANTKVTDLTTQEVVDKDGNRARVYMRDGKRVKADILDKKGNVEKEVFF